MRTRKNFVTILLLKIAAADHQALLRHTPSVHDEHSLIAAFVKSSNRDLYRQILSNPRLRHKFTTQLAHFADFDPKTRAHSQQRAPRRKHRHRVTETALFQRGCCHV